ncbi:MAG TPA: hypothetical protein VFR21_09185 [Bradyrhizobium sp.]|nr:hypothetical protein [Bradyrhizobium sp.]
MVNERLGTQPRLPDQKGAANAVRTLAGRRQNLYIGLDFNDLIYDRVVRVGPFRTRSFLLPEPSLPLSEGAGAGAGNAVGPGGEARLCT